MKKAVLLVALLASAFAQVALAQNDSLTGAWELSNSDRDRICAVTFKNEPVKGGFKVEFDKACAESFPMTKDVQAWTLSNETVRFVDARGRPLMELSEVESGMYEGERPGEGLIFLQAAAAVPPAAKTPEQMFGEWTISRGSAAVCTIALSNRAAGDDSYALQMKPPCDALVTRFNPTLWRMDMGELVLTSPRGEVWRFAAGDGGNWRRVPENAVAIVLTRK